MNDLAVASRYRRRSCIYLSALAFVTFLGGVHNALTMTPWAIGDWLICYRAGFVRRGLPGEVALRLADSFHLSAIMIILCMQLCCYAAIFYTVYRLLRDCSWHLWVVFLLISPATLNFQVLDPWGGFRKEILFLAGLGILILFLQSAVGTPWLTLYTALLVVVCVLSHEALIVFVPYVLAALAIGLDSIPRALRLGIVPVAAAAVALAAVVTHPGSEGIANKLCSDLAISLSNAPPNVCGGAIAFLSRSDIDAHQGVLYFIHAFHYWTVYPLLTLLAAAPIIAGCTTLWRDHTTHRSLRVLAVGTSLSIAFSTVLFVYAIDWGRWIYIHVMCIFLLLLFIDSRHRQLALPAPTGNSAKHRLVLAAFILYATCWNLSHVASYPIHFGYFQFGWFFLRAMVPAIHA